MFIDISHTFKLFNETEYEKQRRGSSIFLKMFPRLATRHIIPSAADVPSCEVKKVYPYRNSPHFTLYGINKTFTAVLTGYPPNTLPSDFKPNKGYLYGWSGTIRPDSWDKAHFSFFRDYAVVPPRKGITLEYCAHIYSPALSINQSINDALGTNYNSDKRDFGNDDNLNSIIIKGNGRNSKKIMSCCFLIHG
ncbi:hypothetical protein BMR1_02g03620 [Babesia microti strain RI]|uniref:Uncharacterized protein n=1 Tax=Babesia microti (strain RI) TaxID=1133968 RepID=I7IGH6_BABMR|nr:hypothetical protein BMR1_02g03620 [Babesia microti strain RI]CCF73876.1 hypothetical protein BMR1_02g03620 [Babesia microti strain RI]|eukprot:XP_012648485.1 hypothetical protein BMR1_02g03620 [Babesia microti strain RI]